MKTNYHAHTFYCGHSTNILDELIQLAIDEGFSHFGVSEHMPIFTNPEREITPTEFKQLLSEVAAAKIKYQGKIKFYFGLECEYHPEMHELVNGYFKMPEIDYLIFGNHSFGSLLFNTVELEEVPDKLVMLADQYHNAETAFASGMFSCFNHPDWFLRAYNGWDEHTLELTKKYIALAIKYDIPLELNLNGMYAQKLGHGGAYMYPHEAFWLEVAKTNVPVIIGVDTHTYKLMSNEIWNEGLQLIRKWGLEKNLVQHIKFQK